MANEILQNSPAGDAARWKCTFERNRVENDNFVLDEAGARGSGKGGQGPRGQGVGAGG